MGLSALSPSGLCSDLVECEDFFSNNEMLKRAIMKIFLMDLKIWFCSFLILY